MMFRRFVVPGLAFILSWIDCLLTYIGLKLFPFTEESIFIRNLIHMYGLEIALLILVPLASFIITYYVESITSHILRHYGVDSIFGWIPIVFALLATYVPTIYHNLMLIVGA